MNLTEILEHYPINGQNPSCTPYGEGHINETMLLTFGRGTSEKYVLQKINDRLFDVEKLMSNIILVSEFIREKNLARGGNPDRECLTVVKTVDGKSFVKTRDGYYRIYLFIDGISLQVVKEPKDFYRCAEAFGRFANLLAEFDATELYEIIPKFHDTEKRFRDFTAALEKDACGRAKDVRKEIDFVLARKDYCGRITSKLKSGEIPVRCTHNDTKLNNVLFDRITNECIAVIDLDTVMPGSLCYDFGDAIRFGCNTSTEDDRDLRKVNFDINLFKTFTEGYLNAIGNGITAAETDQLAFSAILMTYECGMRFLTDYLDGDNYFRISRENHNLDRARTQFKLIEDMEKLLPEMEKIVGYYKK
ncbi:MAG: aminoglycoside phosphotransferase family protein [Clostridia bacterium]|nr:aminoglycoside phosphotransferase family protein [Clostridia bacterium]